MDRDSDKKMSSKDPGERLAFAPGHINADVGGVNEGASTSTNTGNALPPPVASAVPIFTRLEVSTSTKPQAFRNKKGDDFEVWLARMETYFKYVNINPDDRVTLIVMNLDGDAHRAASMLKVHLMPYEECIAALKTHFVPPETRNEWRMKFQTRSQNEDENVSYRGQRAYHRY